MNERVFNDCDTDIKNILTNCQYLLQQVIDTNLEDYEADELTDESKLWIDRAIKTVNIINQTQNTDS